MVFAAVQGLQFFVLVQYKQLRYEWPHIFTDVFGVYVLLGGNVNVLYYSTYVKYIEISNINTL